MKRNRKSILAVATALVLSLCLTGCGQQQPTNQSLVEGGVLCIRVNPEIAVSYDNDGLVTEINARNDDGLEIIQQISGFEGKECREVVSELVTLIGDAGYFVEEIEGESKQVTIEIEAGSKLPNASFLDDVVADVKTTLNTNKWAQPIDIQNESDYGITDYVDTDYGVGSDGYTDYDDTDYGPNNDGITDYNDTDYGPNNDGVTDYDDTDYGPNNDGITDYNDTDYGPNNDGVTDYDDTDYGPNNDGVTDYNDSAYDSSTNYGSNYGSNYD